jgi:hypothetical protein
MTSHLLRHLVSMTDERGLFEHAEHSTPRPQNGYCTDDNARLLAVTSALSNESDAHALSNVALRFVLASQSPDGQTHNRMNSVGAWTDVATTDDCWGRSLWGLGHAAAFHPDLRVRDAALDGFAHGAVQRSRWTRSMSFACIGAAAIIQEHPDHAAARSMLEDTVDLIGPLIDDSDWRWTEPHLRYANAALAEATIAIGHALDRPDQLAKGLEMLGWLLGVETHDGHMSVAGTRGRFPGEIGPQFDQQPIEVAAIADACWRAHRVTGDSRWADGVTRAAAWFAGDNDAGLVMFDSATQGGYDGLSAHSVNINQGAESTLAYVSTMHRAAQLAMA